MRTLQINKLLSTKFMDRQLAEAVGLFPLEIPSKYFVIGANLDTYKSPNEIFIKITWIPQGDTLDEWIPEIADLIKADPVFKHYVTKPLPTNLWALTPLTWFYLNDPEKKPAYERPLMPGETPNPDKDKHIIQYTFLLTDIHGSNQAAYE